MHPNAVAIVVMLCVCVCVCVCVTAQWNSAVQQGKAMSDRLYVKP